MARRPEGHRRAPLSPRTRLVAGWIAAVGIVAVIAIAVGILGGNADGTAVVPTPSGTTAATPGEIAFGTALDTTSQEVATDATMRRFLPSDTFAYSFRPADPPPSVVWVEVRRDADGSGEAVQPPAVHRLGVDARVIGFAVSADALFRDFGTGPFQMRIYLVEGAAPAAVGSFELIDEASSPSP